MGTDQDRDPVSDAIAGEIRAEMARKRITGSTMARMLGWGQQYLSRRLTGSVPLHVGEVVKIADYLEIPLERLFARVAPAQHGRIRKTFSRYLAADLRRSAYMYAQTA